MAPATVPTQPPTYHTHNGVSYTSTIGYSHVVSNDTSVDYEIYYTKNDYDVKEREQVKYYMWLENRLESIDSIQALARMKRRIEDVCARQFIHKVMSIRQPKPKSNLRAKLYK